MPRKPIPADQRVTPYQSRLTRQAALRAAGGWIGTVELSPAAHSALRELQRHARSELQHDLSISETIDDALTLAAARLALNGKM